MLDTLTRRLSSIFANLRAKGKLTEADVDEMLREVRRSLIEADVNFQVAKKFIVDVKQKAVGEELFSILNADQTLIKIVRDELTELLGGEEVTRYNFGSQPPAVTLLSGLQGSGKTTTAAKLARWMVQQGKKPMLAACDRQRPAAIQQLEILGEQIGVPVYVGEAGQTAVQVAKGALDRCKYMLNDVLIVDTAGRLSIDEGLMDELQEVAKAVSPTESLLVLDSTTGQEAVNVAQAFHERVNLTGLIFSKLDGDTRGGAILSVKTTTGVPVRFIGVGEGVEALDQFHPDRVAQRILGFGDILGLIEKAEQVASADDAERMVRKSRKGETDFNDMLSQFSALKKMGPLKNVMKMIPGLAQAIPEEHLDQINETHINRIESIIFSMTLKERANPDIINGSRRKRIASGSGTTVEEVNNLIRQLFEMRRGMKQLSKLQQRMGKNPRGRF